MKDDKTYLYLLYLGLIALGLTSVLVLQIILDEIKVGFAVTYGVLDAVIEKQVRLEKKTNEINSIVLDLNHKITGLDEICSLTAEWERDRYSHQYYVDNPDRQNEYTGNTSFNQRWVENYDVILKNCMGGGMEK